MHLRLAFWPTFFFPECIGAVAHSIAINIIH
jgi:hypothetical protein